MKIWSKSFQTKTCSVSVSVSLCQIQTEHIKHTRTIYIYQIQTEHIKHTRTNSICMYIYFKSRRVTCNECLLFPSSMRLRKTTEHQSSPCTSFLLFSLPPPRPTHTHTSHPHPPSLPPSWQSKCQCHTVHLS